MSTEPFDPDDFTQPTPPPRPSEYRAAQARAASIPPHQLHVLSIDRQRQRVEQCNAEEIAILKRMFIESLSEPGQKFYAGKLEGKRFPTMFIVFAYGKIVDAESSAR